MAAPFSSNQKLEDELTAYGMKLMNPPSTTDELLNLLDGVGSLLKMVEQSPCDSMTNALQLVMKALTGKDLLKHTDTDVKVSVVSCISEFSRITAPQHPFDDKLILKEILQLTVMALEKLSDVTGRSYFKAVQILETVAQVRTCVMLLDLECGPFVIKIFQLFLSIIRPYHPHKVFTKMEEIMTQLIEDSDEISVELLQTLLDSVKKENQITSPVSSKLGEKVLEDCAATVKPYLSEVLKSMKLNPNDYAEIVTSICSEMPKGEQTITILLKISFFLCLFPFIFGGTQHSADQMANGNAPDTLQPSTFVPSESDALVNMTSLKVNTCFEQLKDTCTSGMKPHNPEDIPDTLNSAFVPSNAEVNATALQVDTCMTNVMKPHNPDVPDTFHPATFGPSDAEVNATALEVDAHLDQLKDMCTTNIMCTTNTMRPDNPEDVQSEINAEVVSRRRNKLAGSCVQHPSASKDSGISSGSNGCGDLFKKVESITIEEERIKDTDMCVDRKPESVSRKNKSASNSDTETKSGSSVKSKEGNIGDTEEPSLQQIDEVNLKNSEATFKILDIEGSSDKATKLSVSDENLLKRCAKSEARKVSTGKDEDSKSVLTIKGCGEELIGARIRVWWPSDKRFYEGSISSFDPVKKEHTVLHVDGDREIFNLGKDQLEMVEDSSSQKIENGSAPDTVHPVKVGPSNAKRKAGRGSRKNESASNYDAETKSESSIKTEKGKRIDTEEPSLQHVDGMKQKNDNMTTKIPDTEESGDKDSEGPRTDGEELVGTKIKVWWPLDFMFYEAFVSSYDPVRRSHKVVYIDDGVVEILNLRKQKWEMVEDSSLEKVGTSNSKRKLGRGSRKNEDASNCDAEIKSESSTKSKKGKFGDTEEPSLLQICGMKQKNNASTMKKRKTEESGEKDSKRRHTVEDYGEELVGARIKVWWPMDNKFYEASVTSYNPVTKRHKIIYADSGVEKLNLQKEKWEMVSDSLSVKDSRKPCYGEGLVGANIKVWWPLDKEFYEGTISSFDPVKKKHQIKYVDGDVETLNLREELWKMLEGDSFDKDHGSDLQDPAIPSATSSEKKAKGKSLTRHISSIKR